MKRAAIYGRFSSDLQRDRSIDDQFALCRDFATRQGFSVVATFHDAARSGASVFGREGLMQLLDAAKGGAFDVVVVEALDRLSRDQEDLAGIFKRLTFQRVEIIAVHDGRADHVQVGIRGLVGALYLQDLAHKVRRGMAGVVRDGRNAGGRAYGYRPVLGRPGELEIVEAEAAVIRRIFDAYAAGSSGRDIAADLNRDGVPAPRGKFWTASAINGNNKRGCGILQNEIYAGRLVWNRVKMVRDPDTGKRISRPNPESEWQRADAPHLQIIDPELFDKVKAFKLSGYVGATGGPKRKRLLSGLLKCSHCGSGMSIKDRDHGRLRLVCTQMREAGTCANRRVYYLDRIEEAVIAGLREQLSDRRAIALYVETYNREMRALCGRINSGRAKIETELAAAQRALDRGVKALINGELREDEAGAIVAELRRKRDELQGKLDLAEKPPEVVTLHPAAISGYLAQIDRLADVIADDALAGEREAMDAIRELIERVVVHDAPGGGVEVQVEGRLAMLTGSKAPPHGRLILSGGEMVAGEGLEPPTPGL